MTLLALAQLLRRNRGHDRTRAEILAEQKRKKSEEEDGVELFDLGE